MKDRKEKIINIYLKLRTDIVGTFRLNCQNKPGKLYNTNQKTHNYTKYPKKTLENKQKKKQI